MNELETWLSSVDTASEDRYSLFCFPFAGGDANAYRPWASELPDSIGFNLVHLPGRHSRIGEDPYRDVHPLVEKLVEVLEPALEEPFGLYGHSMGGLIGFEFGRELEARGLPSPSDLFVSARPAPPCPRRFPEHHQLERGEFIEAMQKIGGLPDRFLQDEELLDLFLPTLRADVQLSETHDYDEEPKPTFDAFFYNGVDDPYVNEEEAEAWGTTSTGDFHLRELPGGHFFIDEREDDFLEAFTDDLARASRRASPL